MKINHLSFDLWGTLIKGNPNTSMERAKLFFNSYNPIGRSVEDIRRIIKVIDEEGNFRSEASGVTVQPEHYIVDILVACGYKYHDIPYTLVENIEKQLVLLFRNNPPSLYDTDTLSVLREVSKASTLYLVSNTGFIKGTYMASMLYELGIKSMFNSLVWSNERRYAKPNYKILNLSSYNVLHIGDSVTADKAYADNMKKPYVIINNPNVGETINSIPSISHLPKYITQIENVRTTQNKRCRSI